MRQNETAVAKRLTPRQMLALPYLACAPSLAAGARTAHIGRATLNRWMNDEEFRRQLKRSREQAAELAHIELQGLMLKSVLILADALDDDDPIARVRAARTTLSVALKAETSQHLQQRLDVLEEALSILKRT